MTVSLIAVVDVSVAAMNAQVEGAVATVLRRRPKVGVIAKIVERLEGAVVSTGREHRATGRLNTVAIK